MSSVHYQKEGEDLLFACVIILFFAFQALMDLTSKTFPILAFWMLQKNKLKNISKKKRY